MPLQQITSADIVSLPSGSVSNTQFATGAVETYMSNQGSSFGMRNRLINGDFRVSQYNGSSSTTPTSTVFPIDRWSLAVTQSSKLTIGQNLNNVNTPAGFPYYTGIQTASAYSVGSSDYFVFQQKIEGLNMADFGWGTANAKPVTLSFWIFSSLTGTFGGSIYLNAGAYSYPFTYTITNSSTWQYITITIPGAPSGYGTWPTNNSGSAVVCFSLGVGSTNTGTPGAWTAAYLSATGSTSVVGTASATWYITGVQLEKGSTASAFEYRDYTRELQLCQRYYEVGPIAVPVQILARGNGTLRVTYTYQVSKRTAPTMTTVGLVSGGNIESTSIHSWSMSDNTNSTNYAYNASGPAWTATAEL